MDKFSLKDVLLARMLAARVNVSLRFTWEANTFATDGATVFFPMPLVGKIKERLCEAAGGNQLAAGRRFREVFLGILAHEVAGHVRMTEFKATARGGLAQSILNLLEDIRIEREIPLIFPGARRLLQAVISDMADPLFWRPYIGIDITEAMCYWLMRRLRKEVLGQSLDAGVQKALDRLITQEGAQGKVRECYRIAVDAINSATSTSDLVSAAEQIAALLAQASAQAEVGKARQRAEANQASASKTERGPDSGAADQSEADQSEAGSDSCANQGQSEASDEASSPDGDDADVKPGQASAGNVADQPVRPQNAAQIEERLQEIYNEALQRALNRSHDLDLFENVTVQKHTVLEGYSFTPNRQFPACMSAEEFARGAKISSYLRSNLREVLRSLIEDEDDSEEVEGRFNPRLAPLAVTGIRQDVFTLDGEPAPGLDAHVVLLIDKSGSMSSYESAMRSIVYGIVDALGTIPEVDLDVVYYDYRATRGPKGARRLRDFAKGYVADQSTNWLAAFEEAFLAFANSKRQRKIMFTITDGDVNMDDQNEMVIREMGIEAHFLLIGDHRMPQRLLQYNNAKIAHDGDAWQLARTISGMMKKALDQACA